MSSTHDPGMPEAARREPEGARGLCPSCRHVRVVQSDRGSRFYLCRRAALDPRFRKYPPQPVASCPGHEE